MKSPEDKNNTHIEQFSPFGELAEKNILSENLPYKELYFAALETKNSRDENWAIRTHTNSLATYTPEGERGRSPKHTFFVREEGSKIDNEMQEGEHFQKLSKENFDKLHQDTLKILEDKHGENKIYRTDRAASSGTKCELGITTITNSPVVAAFSENMFGDRTESREESIFGDNDFTLLIVPDEKIDPTEYGFAKEELGPTEPGVDGSPIIVMDMERKIVIIRGFSYLGPAKKAVFTYLSHVLPDYGVLPMHCSANEGKDSNVAIFFGLSGTGKTTLSNDPSRALIGDDEHGLVVDGRSGMEEGEIFNFEAGQYAKTIGLDPEAEPDLHEAITEKRPGGENRIILENVLLDDEKRPIFSSNKLTENTRASIPITYMKNQKKGLRGKTIANIYNITNDMNGVLPPLAMLSKAQAQLYYLMGPTSKVAGTEAGKIGETYSNFFGEPFMPRHIEVYLDLYRTFLGNHPTVKPWLINTGHTGGPKKVGSAIKGKDYGKRISIKDTRRLVDASLGRELDNTTYEADPIFDLFVPIYVRGLSDQRLLSPPKMWPNEHQHQKASLTSASTFNNVLNSKHGSSTIPMEVRRAAPVGT